MNWVFICIHTIIIPCKLTTNRTKLDPTTAQTLRISSRSSHGHKFLCSADAEACPYQHHQGILAGVAGSADTAGEKKAAGKQEAGEPEASN
jgi:hypothetical protein